MSPRFVDMWLFTVLLLLRIPDCSPLSGPSSVTGFVGGSLRVQCQYEERYKRHNKYWCRTTTFPFWCEKIVQTRHSEEATNGRVSIRDHRGYRTFTVTMERLTLEDAGAYKCVVEKSEAKESLKVKVSVLPESLFPGIKTKAMSVVGKDLPLHVIPVVTRAPSRVPSPEPSMSTQGLEPPTSPPVHTQHLVTRADTPGPSPQPRCLLSSVHFHLLVFLELPLLLGMCGAVLWVSRPQRCPAGAAPSPS